VVIVIFLFSVTGKSTSSGGGGGGSGGGDGGSGGGNGGGDTSLPSDCGQSGAAESGRIIEGGTANDKEYPWQVYICKLNLKNILIIPLIKYFPFEHSPYADPCIFKLTFAFTDSDVGACGATIINNQWLLTAAHCVPKPNTGQVVFGQLSFLEKCN
jgi:secreted trypsin-like serine protease